MLAARGDGGRDLVRFGGAEDEDGPLGRLLDGLQEGVEGFAGDLVGFIDDEDFVLVAGGLVADVFAQLAHFIDAAVGGGVDLDDVHGAAGLDFGATGADAAGLVGGAVDAVEATGHDARRGGFAGAALAGKDVAVGDAVLGDGIAQSGFDVLLVEHIVEGLRPVFAGNDLILSGGNPFIARAGGQRAEELRVWWRRRRIFWSSGRLAVRVRVMRGTGFRLAEEEGLAGMNTDEHG